MCDYPVTTIIAAIASLSTVVEVSKIQLNPWTFLFDYIGNALTKKLQANLDRVEKTMQEGLNKNDKAIQRVSEEVGELSITTNNSIKKVERKTDVNRTKSIRSEILDFANTCKNGVHHTQDEFDHILEIHDDYEELIEGLGLKNGRISVEFDYIKDVYRHCLEKGTLLKAYLKDGDEQCF